jgi:hypothetical protein
MVAFGVICLVLAAFFAWLAWGRFINRRTGQPWRLATWIRVLLSIPSAFLVLVGLASFFAPAPPPTPTTTTSVPEVAAAAPQPTPPNTTPPAVQKPVDLSTADPPTLPDSNWVDVSLSLQKEPYGFPEFQPRAYPPQVEHCSRTTDPDAQTDITVCVRHFSDSISKVTSILSGPNARAVATWLFPYLATTPHTGKSAKGRADWVAQNLQNVRPGRMLGQNFAPARIEIGGNPPFSYLFSLKTVNYDAWSVSQR